MILNNEAAIKVAIELTKASIESGQPRLPPDEIVYTLDTIYNYLRTGKTEQEAQN